MKKNLPYFLVIASLIFLIVGVLSSGEDKSQPISFIQNTLKADELLQKSEPAPNPSAVTQQKFAPQQVTQQKPEKMVIFGFEGKRLSWEIPDWCLEKSDYVGSNACLSQEFTKEGKPAVKLSANFPGKQWTAAYIETQEYFDWTPYQTLSADVYIPADAPFGLKAKFILTVGEDWTWTEMSRFIKLTPGEWTTITASLRPGTTDWRRTEVSEQFRADVRKLGIRVESNMQPIYNGPIYIDKVELE